ncbi:cytochrome C and Quinol oxidase polypeptide I family protein (plasmid) [Paraburkholderia fungorum]|uniref:Cbb3-type cytochrome c oxidase subunit I n=1 Tax=Paraburkholderia fungorum TaxID=134537 RepID=A0AAP5QAS1_9BURK|nr:cbb3-type cytochrome c oxidase subunit I [Paraburkholderia fungorum]AJZ56415.1 cytochrome C and Quinol oxidase polypeptide I family protein [Paraburkholderia fungorum]MBB5545076.1 cytochrome c oxidase cbb3-type subunit 1 [Paraburkholderia fungorum]MBU7442447.1 cbb3-type cytochrome c oxidase subunit I [Paraburkholderia fungorum]MDE1007266.1 cbb3-type cytochrome c oxidase subunit I [Paraburkholderia fungorum]MDT8840051.1 cbb3-type cytochrome c oxidase subunit I [Paraburkholderia fungorum]
MSTGYLDPHSDAASAKETIHPFPGTHVRARARTEAGLVLAHGYAAIATLIISAIFGTAVAIKFVAPDFLGTEPWATWGLLRYNHTQGIMFGWLGNAFLCFTYYATPRLAGRSVTGKGLGWLLFVLWNFGMVLPGWALVEANLPQWLLAIKPLEWTEFPLAINAVTELCLALMLVQFALPIVRGPERDQLYISAWYLLGGVVFTLLAFPMGSLVPEFAPGAIGAAFSGLWIHDAVGLFVTPFALAITYYVIPAATGRPVYSHFVSMLGFWVLFFIYPMNGTHHYVYSAIPMDTQRAAIAASVLLGFDVILVVFNQLMSLRGARGVMWRDVPLRFAWVGVVFYLLVSVQGSVQALMPVQRVIHFTDWVIGHSHLAMLGFATFVSMAGILHAWQRTPGARYHDGLANAGFWLLLTGLVLMVGDLTIAGLVQGNLWAQSVPWMDSVRASMPYWWIRVVSAVPVLAGFGLVAAAMLCGPLVSEGRAHEPVSGNGEAVR